MNAVDNKVTSYSHGWPGKRDIDVHDTCIDRLGAITTI